MQIVNSVCSVAKQTLIKRLYMGSSVSILTYFNALSHETTQVALAKHGTGVWYLRPNNG